jgi:hypothetical protein
MSAVKNPFALGLNLFFRSAVYNPISAYLNFGNSTPPQLASAQWSLSRLGQLENKKMETFCQHHCAVANTGKTVFAHLLRRRVFIAVFQVLN